jgi:site-specific recombinase XerD
MPVFLVEKVPEENPVFRVVGPEGEPVAEIQEFLAYLETCDRSAYTMHSYALGLAHFFRWLHESGKQVDDVTRYVVEQYIGAFGRAPKHRPGARELAESNTGSQTDRMSAFGNRRRPRTINHRLSVLASYFAYCIQRDGDQGSGAWFQRANPISTAFNREGRRRMAGRDRQARGEAREFRKRVPRELHRTLDPAAVVQLINAANSYRDKSIFTLLFRTGQRIGDWNNLAGRHGVLGMELADIDEGRRTITIRLKGDRDEHRVPVTEDFWPLFHRYLADERGTVATTSAVWLGVRKGKGKPLSYTAFESSVRYISRKIGLNVHAHMFRHTVAQAVLETTGNLKVAQELLGHAQVSTTADLYMHVDEPTLVKAVAAVRCAFDRANDQVREVASGRHVVAQRYAFAYDELTIEELEMAATQPRREHDGKDF